jgi:hypothetical protein
MRDRWVWKTGDRRRVTGHLSLASAAIPRQRTAVTCVEGIRAQSVETSYLPMAVRWRHEALAMIDRPQLHLLKR